MYKDDVVCNGQLVRCFKKSKKLNSNSTMKKVVTLRCTKRGSRNVGRVNQCVGTV